MTEHLGYEARRSSHGRATDPERALPATEPTLDLQVQNLQARRVGRHKEFDPEHAVAEAMNVFWAQGYGATSPQQLADRLRIGKGSFYNAFGNKRRLFDRALGHYLDQRIEGLRYWQDRPGPAREVLREALLFVATGDPANPDRRGCLATNSAVELGRVDEAVASRILDLFDRAESMLTSLVDRGQREGGIRRDVDARALAAMLLNSTTGLHVLARLDPGPDRMTRVVDATLALL